MNRKMRAKVNNQAAKARKSREPCPKQDELTTDDVCSACGQDTIPVVALVISEEAEQRTLH
jgi:hypothetical protein